MEASEIIRLKSEELQDYLRVLKTVFPMVRVLDGACLHFQMVDEQGALSCLSESACYQFWGRHSRCQNCISSMVMQRKGIGHKFEIKGEQVYLVFSRYVEIDGAPHIIEMLSTVENDLIKTGSVDLPFKEAIYQSNNVIYMDPQLNIYNRRFYEEQMKSLSDLTAVAYIDIDHFKTFNDTYGHATGDQVLKLVVDTIRRQIRRYDALIRMGGDEFVIAFSGIPASCLNDKLMNIKRAVQAARHPDMPDLSFDISVGACFFSEYSRQAVIVADEQMYLVKHCPDKVAVTEL